VSTAVSREDVDDEVWFAGVPAMVAPAVAAAVGRLAPRMREVCEYQLGRVGKAMRPALTLASAVAVGGTAEAALPGAVAVELLHNCTLLQDDVMDEDPVRRHRPAAWTVFGPNPAILAGDALLALAFAVLAGADRAVAGPAALALASATDEVIEGQAMDLAFERADRVSVADGRRMSDAKTAALLGCACRLGGLFAGACEDVCALLDEYGRHLGAAYQLRDDLLGIWGDPTRTGKVALVDLRRRKKSLPVVAALAADNAAADRLRALYGRAEALTEDELRLAVRLVEDAGGQEWAERAARAELAAADETLAALARSGAVTARLAALGRFTVGRDR
jgi:geranylgeranyl diphosphate synthase type I